MTTRRVLPSSSSNSSNGGGALAAARRTAPHRTAGRPSRSRRKKRCAGSECEQASNRTEMDERARKRAIA